MHWVGWGKKTKPKKEGGLGLHSAKGKNLALLAKLNWRFHNEKNTLWRKILEKKYLTPCRLASKAEEKLPCSRNCLAMRKGRDIFKADSRWILGRKSNLIFREDNWLSSGPIHGSVKSPLSLQEANLQVKDVGFG